MLKGHMYQNELHFRKRTTKQNTKFYLYFTVVTQINSHCQILKFQCLDLNLALHALPLVEWFKIDQESST